MEAFKLFNNETKEWHEDSQENGDILLSQDGKLVKYKSFGGSLLWFDVTDKYTRCDYIGIKDKHGQKLYDRDKFHYHEGSEVFLVEKHHGAYGYWVQALPECKVFHSFMRTPGLEWSKEDENINLYIERIGHELEEK